MPTLQWAHTVVLIDADYLDERTKEFSAALEKITGNPIPKADLCHWLDCVALDGGLRPGTNDIQAVFIHSKSKKQLQHFIPSDFQTDLDGKAFSDNLGEFTLLSFPIEDIVSADDFFNEALAAWADAKEVERLLVVGNMQTNADKMMKICADTDGKAITLFVLEPDKESTVEQQGLLFSLMSALGVQPE